MPTAMMRPRNISPALVRSKASGKHVSGTPQWMRTLEDKYQKLHKKITENTNNAGMRYSQSSGRTVHDIRLAQVVAKYRDISAQQKPNNKLNLNKQQTETMIDQSLVNNNINNDSIEPGINTEENQTGCLNNHKRETCPGRISCICNEINLNNTGNGPELTMEAGDHVSSYSSDSGDEFDENIPETAPTDMNGNKTNVKKDNTGHSFVTVLATSGKEMKNNNGEENIYNRSNLKTAISRTSRNTSKSCPAKIQTQVQASAKPTRTTRTPLTRCKSAQRFKTFAPLSQEGQHAITETIHEMHVNRSVTVIGHQTDSGEYIPSRSRRCVRSWDTPRPSLNSGSAHYDAKEVLNDVSKRIQILQDSKLDNCADLDCRDSPEPDGNENESCHSLVGSSPELRRKNSAALPEIQQEPAETINVKSQQYRLPGIGTYDVPLKAVFEITPPGFDSRYTYIGPVLEERESETPPPDIRQKAIDKCSEWLVKYNK